MLAELQAELSRDPLHNQTGLILIDIREFRELNRSFGEACGDTVLLEIEKRLATLPANAYQTYYLGNDEFGIVIRNLKSPGFAVIVLSMCWRTSSEFSSGKNTRLK